MEFLLSYFNTSLLLYFIYSLFIIYLVALTNKLVNKKKAPKLTLSDDQYFVLNNNYDVKNIFCFITYKLYQNRTLLLNPTKSSFCLNKDISFNLNEIEREISTLYTGVFSPNDFNIDMINEEIFKNYYSSISNSLTEDNFVKSKKIHLICKIIFSIGLFFTLLPGIVILALLHNKNIILSKIIGIIIINSFTYFFFLKDRLLNILTPQAIIANELYKKQNSFNCNSFKDNSYFSDLNKFLLQSCYMYYYNEDDGENDCDD